MEPTTDAKPAFEGDELRLRSYLFELPAGSFYTYVLLRPTGEPFYVGKGTGNRLLQHRLEALRSSPLSRSNPFKCNTIRQILLSGHDLHYRLDRVYSADAQLECLKREEELIALYRRRCDGGTLTNLAAGLGSAFAPDPFSTDRHAATLSGVSDERPERTALNLFLRALGGVDSVPIKPLSEYRVRLINGYPSPKPLRTLSRRNGLTIVASALASGLQLASGVRIPRSFTYAPDADEWPLAFPMPDKVIAVIENGALSDILKLRLADLVPAARPEDEAIRLDDSQIERLAATMGRDALVGWGLLQA